MTYITNVCKMAKHLVTDHCATGVAIDATLGNGNDTDFLRTRFDKVYAFDIQAEAVDAYAAKGYENVTAIHASHSEMADHITEGVDCIMFNLGYLPGGDPKIVTEPGSSLAAIKQGMELLNSGGMMTIAIYLGHEEGHLEKDAILSFAKTLKSKQWSVVLHTLINRHELAPLLLVFEKR